MSAEMYYFPSTPPQTPTSAGLSPPPRAAHPPRSTSLSPRSLEKLAAARPAPPEPAVLVPSVLEWRKDDAVERWRRSVLRNAQEGEQPLTVLGGMAEDETVEELRRLMDEAISEPRSHWLFAILSS